MIIRNENTNTTMSLVNDGSYMINADGEVIGRMNTTGNIIIEDHNIKGHLEP